MSQVANIDLESANPQVPTSFTTDLPLPFGTAIPILNNLEILGGPGIETSASGKTITISLEGGGQAIDTLTPNSGTSPVVPNAAGNITLTGSGSLTSVGGLNSLDMQLTGLTNHAVLVGAGTSTITKIPNGTTGQVLTANTGADPSWQTNSAFDYHTARWIVSAGGLADGANYTTIADAYAAALAAGGVQTVFIQSGTYNESLTLRPNINLAAFDGSSDTPTVIINGKLTYTLGGSLSISNIRLQTNGDNFLGLTGSSSSILHLNNCYLNCTDFVGISFTSSSTSSQLRIVNCRGNVAATRALFDASALGTLTFDKTNISGLSTTASTISSGGLVIRNSILVMPITTSGDATLSVFQTNLPCSPLSTTALTCNSTGTSTAEICSFGSGSQPAISIGDGATLRLVESVINSSNTNAITGSGTGTLQYNQLSFTGSSSTINTPTQTVLKTGPSVEIGSSNSGGTNTLSLTNTATTASSSSLQQVTVGGTSAGDPFTTYTVTGGSSWSAGVDNSASDAYVISASTALGTTNVLSMATGGAASFVLGNLDVTRSANGAAVSSTVSNTSNTASSSVNNQLTVAGTSAGDAQTTYTVSGTTNWSMGLDNSVTGDPFVLAASTALGTTNVMSAATTGEINYPLQPAFLGYLAASTSADKTGDASIYALGTDALTEVYDQGGDFTTGGTFTAPVTGVYELSAQVTWTNLGATNTSNNQVFIITTGRTYTSNPGNLSSSKDTANGLSYNVHTYCDMIAGNTSLIRTRVSGGTKTVGISGSANAETRFSGKLVC